MDRASCFKRLENIGWHNITSRKSQPTNQDARSIFLDTVMRIVVQLSIFRAMLHGCLIAFLIRPCLLVLADVALLHDKNDGTISCNVFLVFSCSIGFMLQSNKERVIGINQQKLILVQNQRLIDSTNNTIRISSGSRKY